MSTNFIQSVESFVVTGIGTSETQITLSNFKTISGVLITQAMIGGVSDYVPMTLSPRTEREEQVLAKVNSISGQNVILDILRAVNPNSPYNVGGGVSRAHNVNDTAVISNNPALFNKLTAKDNNETVTANWAFTGNNTHAGTETFTNTVDTTGTVIRVANAVANNEPYNKGQVDTALALKANDNAVVKLTGNQTVAGVKTFSSPPIVPTATASGEAINKGQAEAYVAANSGSILASDSAFGTTKLDVAADTPSNPKALTATVNRLSLFFGGNGSDGVLNVVSGTTTLDLSVKTVWQYTSITIASGATLTFTGGTAGDKVPVLRCQGNFSNAGIITTVGLGIAGGVGGAAGVTPDFSFAGNGTVGSDSNLFFADLTKSQGGRLGSGARNANSTGPVAGVQGAGGALSLKRATYFSPAVFNGAGGAGGGGGGVWTGGNAAGTGGAGGAGSLALVIEVLGSFTNTGTINTSGGTGTAGANGLGNGSQSSGSGGGGGGGGGGAGSIIIRYKGALTISGSFLVVGGASGVGGNTTSVGGAGGSFAASGGGGGGGGGASAFQDGALGASGSSSSTFVTIQTGGTGGAGGAGIVYIEKVN